jgi:hypothetical protein
LLKIENASLHFRALLYACFLLVHRLAAAVSLQPYALGELVDTLTCSFELGISLRRAQPITADRRAV